MNDIEIIEHWALREALVLWLGVAVAFSILALGSLFAAFYFFSLWLLIAAGAAFGALALCAWRMRRILCRLDELEQFIP
jgi:hypothetical protein